VLCVPEASRLLRVHVNADVLDLLIEQQFPALDQRIFRSRSRIDTARGYGLDRAVEPFERWDFRRSWRTIALSTSADRARHYLLIVDVVLSDRGSLTANGVPPGLIRVSVEASPPVPGPAVRPADRSIS
jgi:hypothetical protein